MRTTATVATPRASRLPRSLGASLSFALVAAACGPKQQTQTQTPTAETRRSQEWGAISDPRAESESAGGPDDVQIQHGGLGTIDSEAVESTLKKGGTDINACYQGGVTKFRYLSGRLEIKARVQKDGSIKSLFPVNVLGSTEVEKCILDTVKKLRFPSPKGGNEAEFEYAWEFRAKAPLQEWGATEVQSVFTKHQKDMRVCESKGSVPPGLRVVFYVTPGGKVGSVGIGADGAVEDAYATCVASKVSAWKFADPEGRVARATYQF